MCKKAVSLISLVVVLALVGNASAELVAQWKLDDGAGTTAVDATGNGHNGQLIGNPKWVIGNFGGGLSFSDTADKVDVPYSPQLNPENEFTVSLWANVDPAGSGFRSPITSRNTAPVSGYLIYCTSANTWYFYSGNADGGFNGTEGSAVAFGEWTHVTATYSGGDKKLYVDGELVGESSAVMAPNTTQGLRIGAGATEGDGNYFFNGMIDDVRVYDHVLTDGDIKASMENQGSAIFKAYGAKPPQDVMIETTWANLQWRAGSLAASHNLYMGDNFDDVNNATTDSPTFMGNYDVATTSLFVGFTPPFAGGLVPGTTYYWRIDEVNDADPNSPWKGDIWSFWIEPIEAYEPTPADGANYMLQDVTLSWTPGMGSEFHYVYFGDNFDDVNSAEGADFKPEPTFTPDTLEPGKTYYWRVDESADFSTIHRGDIWSFTTVPNVPVTDADLQGLWTLNEETGTTAVDWSGHGNHGTLVGEPQWATGYELGALEFDGGDYVDTGYTEDLATWTIACWVKSPQSPGAGGGQGPMHRESNYQINWNHGSDVFQGAIAVTADGAWHAASFMPIQANRWYYIAGTFDGTLLNAYRDGVLITRNTAAVGVPSAESASLKLGRHATASGNFFVGTIDEARVYNRVLTAEEIQQAMQGNTKLAGDPVPDRDAIVDIRNTSSLSWSAGDAAASHDVYFGTDRDAVAGADNSAAEFQGNQAGTGLSLASLVEFGGGDYYWRVDEVEPDGTINTGTVWKFTVLDYLIVDDFESYNDIEEDQPGSNRVFLTWIDGYEITGNGSMAGNENPPFMVQGRNSAQAMPVSYDLAGKISEATRTLTGRDKDWTANGVTKLVLWFRGNSDNSAERIFIALGNAVVYNTDDAATQDTGWNEWEIDLQEFADQGVNLADVPSITIGFGTKDVVVPDGGTGTVEFDDIVLVP